MKLMRNFNNKGFSLIELLIVCGMIGLVMAALFTLYQANQKTASTQEDVVEVQQNLRTAMDSISKDIKMAGFLAPLTPAVINPINDGFTNGATTADPDSITINTASEAGVYARITADTTSGASTTFPVDSVDNFAVNDVVRIIRPQDGSQPIGDPVVMTVSGIVTGPPASLTIATTTVDVSYLSGDVIARTTAGAANPNTIQYALSPAAVGTTCSSNCLTRTVNGAAPTGNDVIANNITNLQFKYILDNNLETDTPAAADMATIRAVRVTIIGQTNTNTALSEWRGAAKTRQMASIIRIRNRRQ